MKTRDESKFWERNPFNGKWPDEEGYDDSDPHDYEPAEHPGDYGGDPIDPSSLPPWLHRQEPFDAIDLATALYPEFKRPFLVEGWLPLGETIGLGGPGGEGKTLIAQMLANAAALGANWLGLPVQQMKSALLLFEDYRDDTLWRQQDIAPAYNNVSLAALAPWVMFVPRRSNEHNYLAVFDRDDQIHETVFFSQLLKRLIAFADGQPLLTVIDCKSDVFWGKQNDERHARVFVKTICDRIARETQGTVILIYHPSKTGMTDNTGMSGSVQWDAAFGARLYFAGTDKDDPDKRTLALLKANHAQKGKEVEVQWEKGIFRTVEDIDANKAPFEVAAEMAAKLNAFRDGFAKAEKRGENLSPQPTSRNYAPKRIAVDQPVIKGKKPCSIDDLGWAMGKLIEDGEFASQDIGKPSKPQFVLRRS